MSSSLLYSKSQCSTIAQLRSRASVVDADADTGEIGEAEE